MIKKLIVLLLIANVSTLYAQSAKTDVLVIGNGASAVAAAVQCARSKVKTILAAETIKLGDRTLAGKMTEVSANRDVASGSWAEFRKEVQAFYKTVPGYDTAYNAVLKLKPADGAAILQKIADSTKNLTVYLNTLVRHY